MNIILRNGQSDDIDGVFNLAKKLAMTFELAKSEFIKSFAQIIADDSAHLVVATHNNAIIGYCLGFDHLAFFSNGRVSWLQEILVKGEFRQMGIGKRLLKDFETWCVSRNSVLVSLATHSANSFYEILGYKKFAAYYRKIF